MSADHQLTELASLFCKPVSVNYPGQLLYSVHDPELNTTISFRSLQLETDIDFLYDWVNRTYAKRFWQLNGSKSILNDTYQTLLANPNAHSFIGLCDGKPVCQVDLYNVSADELKDHTDHSPDDCGLHLLMLPPHEMRKGLSVHMLSHFVHFYFSFPASSRLFAEPDKENSLANRLATKAGFRFLKTIELSYKTANLYCITKDQYYAADTIA